MSDFGFTGGTGGPPGSGGSGGSEEGDQPDPFGGLGALFGNLFGGGGGLGALGGALGGAGGGAPFFSELEKLLRGGSGGPVNWELARQTAVRAASEGDTDPTPVERRAVSEALRLADLWLDAVTVLPAAGGATEAWTRRQWVEATLPVWKQLCDPVAASVVRATSGALGSGTAGVPPELQAALGPVMGMVQQVGGLLFGMQMGQALGALAREVVGSSDVGVPLAAPGRAALLPTGVAAFADGLDVDADQVRLYLALREQAHARLFVHVPWLREHVLRAVTDYAAGVRVDTSGVERLMRDLDPTRLDPAALQEALGEGLFTPSDTPMQKAALERLETVLALVEGWVDEVVDAAAQAHLPGAGGLRETLRRRRAAGGPAEQTFATLVGLELRPRRLRDAARLWSVVEAARGVEGRDAVWASGEDLPTPGDLDDPHAFVERDSDVEKAVSSLDDDLRRLTGEADPPAEA